MDDSLQNPGGSAALAGIKVLDLSEFDAGTLCAEFLAWLGADVVKIENPAHANSGRSATTETPGVDSYAFILLNANKRSVTCDLQSERGKEDLRKLIAKSDVLVQNLAPGTTDKLGFGYDALRKLNPRIIVAGISGFPADGPRSNYLSGDMVAQAVGGAISGTGVEDAPPLKPGPAIGDTAAALHATMGILAAIHQRHVTGRGQKIDVAMQEAVINLGRTAYIGPMRRGKALERRGNAAKSDAVPSNLYPCKPGGANDYVFLNISRGSRGHWERLLKAIGREELVGDPRFSTPHSRFENRAEVDAMITEWCREHTKIEAMDAIQRAGAPAGAVLDAGDLTEDAHLRKRGMFVTIDHPVRGEVTMPGWPVKMSKSHMPVRSAPLLGEHTEEVLRDWLGANQKGLQEPNRELPPGANLQNQKMTHALSGVRIVDITQFESGTSCTEALAWLGADVAKIEEPTRGDKGRFGNTDKPGVDAQYFLLLNANKRSVTCDLKSARGKELLKQLIMKADVLVENMAPGAIERLGFGYDVVRELNPRIIYAQIKGFPPDGPHANYLCFDAIAQSAGGSVSVTGVEGEPPVRPGPNLGDTGGGMHCVTGILAALCQRQRNGCGQRIEVAMQEAVINFCRNAFAAYLASGKSTQRYGQRVAAGAGGLKEIYPCIGGGPNDYCFIRIAGIADDRWQRLLRAVGRDDALDDPRFADAPARARHSDEIDALLAAWCRQHPKVEVMDIVQGAGVPAGAVLDAKDLSDDPDLRKSGMFATINHPARGAVTMPGWPVRMSDSRVPVCSAPLLGEHTEAVLAEWLGLRKQEMQELQNAAPVTG